MVKFGCKTSTEDSSPLDPGKITRSKLIMSGDDIRAFPDLSLNSASRFVVALGLVFDEVSADVVTGHIELGQHHHSPWAIVHGGVYSTVVERAGSVGASRAVADCDQFAVGLHNSTDVFVTSASGRAEVKAEPVYQGEIQQVWSVVVRSSVDGTLLARGQLRLQNIPHRTSNHG